MFSAIVYPPFSLVVAVFTVQFIEDVAAGDDADEVFFFNNRNDLQVFGHHDAGDLFDFPHPVRQ